jgi:hypothetical protein
MASLSDPAGHPKAPPSTEAPACLQKVVELSVGRTKLLERYSTLLRSRHAEFLHGQALPPELLLAEDRNLQIYYAPFDFVNPTAKVVLVGITPGLQQAVNALNAARQGFLRDASTEEVARVAKSTGSFSGPMRRNLVDMLNYIGLDRALGLPSCEALFSAAVDKVHFTSMLRYPVFASGKDYNGSPAVLGHPLLEGQVREFFARELVQLRHAVIVPLGPKVQEVVTWLAGQGVIDEGRVLSGMPHPSGANAERIAYFLGRKPRELLSSRTNANTIDLAKSKLLNKMAKLGSLG